MAKWTQDKRPIAINTPLGKDVLLLKGFSMSEELGRPFVIQLDLRSEKGDIDFTKIVGENVSIRVNLTSGKTRFINGFISRFSQEEYQGEEGANKYRAEMVPWLWFLTRTADCKIFQKKKIPDIVKDVFDGLGFSDYEFRLTGTYEAKDYVVQYRETAFNFVSRLLEHEGIYYWFKHENGKHVMILTDSPAKHEVNEGYDEIKYLPADQTGLDYERWWDVTSEMRVRPGKVALIDYDYKAPTKNLYAEKADPKQHAQAEHEVYDYPGFYFEHAHGTTYAGIRNEELAASHDVVRMSGDVRFATAGQKFKLINFPREDLNKEYVVTGVTVAMHSDEFEMGKAGDGEDGVVQTSIVCIPATVQFRTPRSTPKPYVAGPQTAFVVGPDGEEIFTDPNGYSQVKVHFHWDRVNKGDENASCWIGVSQNWAGKRWGALFLPRIGQEVIVDFLEGDPDRPIITGRVYNAENMPPYKLPDNKTMSAIKSNSSKGGEGFNEIRFEDKKGDEQVFIHAEKNMDVRVKNDYFQSIGHERHVVVELNEIVHIKNDHSSLVDNNVKQEIGVDRSMKIGGKEAVSIADSKSLEVGGNVIEEFGADQSTKVAGQISIKADKIVLEAGTNITLKVGGSFIAIDSGSADVKTGKWTMTTSDAIEGKSDGTVKFEATGTGDFKSTGALTCKSDAAATFEAGAAATFKGGASAALTAPSVAIG